jgi:hypothetical protein
MLESFATPGDKMRELLNNGDAVCEVTFSTGSVEIGTVRYYGVHEGRKLWVLVTPNSQHFFGMDEVRDIKQFIT